MTARVKDEVDMTAPAQIRALRLLIGVQLYRLAGLTLLPFASSLPSSFLIPTVTGDALTAVFAPIIAFTIGRKPGPRRWAAALIWNVLGMTDLFYALTIGSLTSAGSFVMANDPSVIIGAVIGIVLHVISIILLLRRSNVSYLISMV